MDSSVITSMQNPKVKAVVQLHQNKTRRETGYVLIEGRHPIEEALRADLEILEYYIREDEKTPLETPVEAVPVTTDVMAKMCTTDTPAPMIAVAKAPHWNALNVFDGKHHFILGLVGLQDPGNLGNLVRSACAFGATALLTVGSHVDPYHPKVIRASAGLIFRLPVVPLPDFTVLSEQLQSASNVTVWGADAHQGKSYREVTFGEKTLLLLGAEAQGLPEETWKLATPIHIPIHPQAESLNVATAGAILLAEAYQQQRLKAHS
jgi:RNA methyltransferase, TrmH family